MNPAPERTTHTAFLRDIVSTRLVIAGVALVLVLVVAGGWYLLSPADEDADEGDADEVHYWHCPNCGLEMTCPPGREDEVTLCPHCANEKVAFEVITHPKGLAGALPRGPAAALVVLALSMAVLLAVTAVVLGRRGRSTETRNEAPTHWCHCPGCSQRLRYAQSQAGRKAHCRVCNEEFVFPAPTHQTAVPGLQEDVAAWQEKFLRRRASRKRRPD